MASAFAADTGTATQAAPDAAPYELSAEKMMQDNLLILALLFFIFYFILIRPQQKRLKMHRELVKGLQKGNKVMTGGGIIGTVIKLDGDDIVIVEIAPNVRVRAMRDSITEILDSAPGMGETANDN